MIYDLEKLENLPNRESRWQYLTRKYGNIYNILDYRRYDKCKAPWKIADIILENNIGKSFDLAFSYFCKKVNHQQHLYHYFLSNFTTERWYRKYYFTDNKGNIQKYEKEYPKKKLTIYSEDYKSEIRHKITGHKKEDFEPIYELIKKTETYRNHFLNKPISREYSVRGKFLYYEYCAKPYNLKPQYVRYKAIDKDFENITISGKCFEFNSKNHYLFKRLTSEKEKRKRKENRELERKKKEIQYNFLTKSELEQKVNKQENDIKIIKHGFDLKTSFRKPKEQN
jgi:hypothetical protein